MNDITDTKDLFNGVCLHDIHEYIAQYIDYEAFTFNLFIFVIVYLIL